MKEPDSFSYGLELFFTISDTLYDNSNRQNPNPIKYRDADKKIFDEIV